nr:TonB-dependent receptor [Schwartzia sp. (in: firmicutes)]
MKKKWVKAAVLGAVLVTSANAYAAEAETAEHETVKKETAESLDEYVIDETIVTATRSEKRDVDIPAATDVITAEDIKAKGAKNAAEALYYTNGFIAKTHGPIGASFGTMTNEA